ncbi:subtilisin family serine protease [Actinoalloteichus hoggarensis]|uniref:Bacillopeptidase F n=1 Tax=Actinoalloteichus hoggarensis TaxID=1470176 RepID=A0A221W1V8_9PSEU|nr:S8 family serine peptidase [Actinoalloteichus hoggarensis]ASO19748.1 Bacillopeptidase F precursor [Actinoalloteichus hoggarensis]MBB5919544.1 subtilisin family serine protease [Actinoalloteichus hoggarensis]
MSGILTSARRSRRLPAGSRGAPGLVLGAVAALFMAGAAPSVAQQSSADDDRAPIDADVLRVLREEGAGDVWIVLEDRADLSEASATADWAERGHAVVDALRGTAEQSQAEAVALLTDAGADFTPYWISNRVLVRSASESLADSISRVPGVDRISLPTTLEIPGPIDQPAAEKAVDGIEWGIDSINADDVWADYGFTGEGIVIGAVDTGVEFDHPALVDAYRGNLGNGGFDHDHNWFDPTSTCGSPAAVPCDNHGHGTHVTGTMIGDDGAGNQIGVAPGARWISAKGCEGGTGCSESALLGATQWMLAPTDTEGRNPRPDLRPHIVNNSWGVPNGPAVDPTFDEVIAAWNASGIFALFSNGNSGPGCDTIDSPADSVLAYGVGAHSVNNTIANSSGRGPGADGTIRPSITAPGVSVRSALPGALYGAASGTSMAAPHVAGSVALLWSAAPSLIGDVEATRALLDTTAVPVDDTSCGGTPADNNVWGKGRLDVLAAVDAAPRGDAGILTGTVTDSTTGEPVAAARVAVSGPQNRAVVAAADGTFTLMLPVGEYAVTGNVFGYAEHGASAAVLADETATVTLALTALPTHAVSGRISDAGGTGLAGVEVVFGDGELPSSTTDAGGDFVFDAVPVGTHRLAAQGSGCAEPQVGDAVVANGDTIVDFALADVTDAYGNFCRVQDGAFLAGDTRLALSGDDASETVALPFPITFYGQHYEQGFVATNGFLSFVSAATESQNTALPSALLPNGAVYPFWDDLIVDETGGILTGVSGVEGERVFVVEWRDVLLADSAARITFSVAFHEAGGLTFGYADLPADEPGALGGSATVGIENFRGGDALQYSFDRPVLAAGTSIRFHEPGGAAPEPRAAGQG